MIKLRGNKKSKGTTNYVQDKSTARNAKVKKEKREIAEVTKVKDSKNRHKK